MSAEHPPDPILKKGMSPIYPQYRSSDLGRSLLEVLQSAKDGGHVPDDIHELILKNFDEIMTEKLDSLGYSDVSITGNTINFKFIYNFFQIDYSPGVIQLPEGTISADCLEVIACNAEMDEKGRKRRK